MEKHDRCTATYTDQTGAVIACDQDHDDGERVQHSGQHPTIGYARLLWASGPYNTAPISTMPGFSNRTPSLLDEQIEVERMRARRR